MKRITTSFMVILLTFVCSLSTKAQSVEATTAWFNGETFETSTLGSVYWSGTTPNGLINTNTKTNVSTSGNVLAISYPVSNVLTEGTSSQLFNTTNTFSTPLSGVIYAKLSAFHCTRGTGYVFKNTDGNTVFGFGSKDGNASNKSNLRYSLDGFIASGGYLAGNPTLVEVTSLNWLRSQWYDWEMVIDLNAKKLISCKATKTGGASITLATNISLTNGGSIDKLNIVTPAYGAAGLDNVTIGELLPDKIANLTGVSDIQTSSTVTNETFSLTATADIASLSLTNIVVPSGNIVWSISDWGGLPAGDQSLVSITRSASNHSQATLSISGAVSVDASITVQAQLGSGTPLTKVVNLKALTLSGIKASLNSEITTATNLKNAVTDSNPYIAGAKSTLTTAITSAQDKYDNSTSIPEVQTEIGLLKTSGTNFSSAMSPYNTYVSYIGTVTAGRDTVGTNYPSAAFFPAIKATLNTAVGIATAAKDTISVAGGITNAQTALTTAYTQFNTDRPAFYALGTQIGTSQAKYAIANTHKGDTKFLQYPAANVDNLLTAITAAQSSQNTATTASDLTTATSTLAAALNTFNGLSRVTPSSNYYRIYSYGVNDGDGANPAVKNILFAHTNRTTSAVSLSYSPLVNATPLALGDSALWTITAGATVSSYIIQNKATGEYLSGTGFSATSAEFTLPEAKSGTGVIQFPGDPNFLYAIVNNLSKGLEIDAWSSPYGAFTINSGVAERYRFCYQFEEALTPVISTTESSLPVFEATVGTSVNKTLSLSGSNLYGTMTLSVTGANAGLFTVTPTTFEVTNTYLSNSTVAVTYTPTAATTTNDVATLSIGIAGGNTLTYNLEGQATVATDINSPENTMKVYSVDNRLIVNGVNSYEVYNLQGMKIIDIKNNNANTTTILNKGIYFVKSNDIVQKVSIK